MAWRAWRAWALGHQQAIYECYMFISPWCKIKMSCPENINIKCEWQESFILCHLWGYINVTVNLGLSYFCYTDKERPIKETKRAQNNVKGFFFIILIILPQTNSFLKVFISSFLQCCHLPLSHFTGSTCRMLYKPRLLISDTGSTPVVCTGSAFPKLNIYNIYIYILKEIVIFQKNKV